jgi:hypothetical protein
VLPLLQDWLYSGIRYAYPIGGVGVDKSAIGAPFDLRLNSFRPPFGVFDNEDWGNQTAGERELGRDQDLEYATACLPILSKNPVKCQKAGSVSVNGSQLRASTDGCDVLSAPLLVDTSTDGASVNGLCTSGHGLGTGTAVIGSVNWQAARLQDIIELMPFNTSTATSYTVSCFVDIIPAVSY